MRKGGEISESLFLSSPVAIPDCQPGQATTGITLIRGLRLDGRVVFPRSLANSNWLGTVIVVVVVIEDFEATGGGLP